MQQAVELRFGRWALNRVHNADALIGLQGVSSDSLDVAITSPPYWGQRGSDGLGSEPDPRDYIRNLVAILAETMRCLKPSGTLWLNIGDCYNTPINWREDDYGYSSLGKEGMALIRPTQRIQRTEAVAEHSCKRMWVGYATEISWRFHIGPYLR